MVAWAFDNGSTSAAGNVTTLLTEQSAGNWLPARRIAYYKFGQWTQTDLAWDGATALDDQDFRWGYYFGGAHTTGSAGLADRGGVIYSSSAGGSYDSFIGQRIPLPEVHSGYASMLEKPVAEVQRAIKQRLDASGRFSTAKLRYSTLVIGDAFTSTFSAGFWTPLADDVARQEAYLGLSNTWTATFTRLSANTAADAAMILATAGAGKGVSATRAGVALKAAWAGKAGWAGLAATRGTAIGLSSAGVVLGGIGVYNGVGQMADGNKYGLLSIARGAEAMIGGGLGMYNSTRGLGAAMRNVRAAAKRTVIGKVDDLKPGNLRPGERTLLDRLPDQGRPKANWRQNSSVLRQEMSRGQPIRDASAHLPDTHPQVHGKFLGAERNLRRNHGWTFDKSTGMWNPPKGGG